MAPTSPRIVVYLVSLILFLLSSNAHPFTENLHRLTARQSINLSPQDRSQQVRSAITEAGFEFIEPQSYFAVSGKCKTDTRNVDRTKWANRFDFYKQAIQDATQIAKGAEKWPQYGSDASDLYMRNGLTNESDPAYIYVLNITKNIKAAANWEHPRWGFDSYITLTCDDPFNACNGRLGGDTRSVGCYVNNTMDLWGTISWISCCAPFFTLNDNKQAFDYGKSKDINKLGLDWMRTGGSFLVHEMMHTVKITQERPRVRDNYFDGSRRIYGPIDCAKAAADERLDVTATVENADSYAEFMLAMYWKDLFNGKLLPPSGTLAITEAPASVDQTTGDIEMVSDNDDNYIDFSTQASQPQLTCAGQPADKPPATQAWISAQITDYCFQLASTDWIVNSTLGQYGPKGYAAGDTAPASDNDLWLSVSHDPGCDANTAYEVELSRCHDFFNMALNGCNTDSVTAKWGGQVQANCALWNITTRAGHNMMPPNGYPATPQQFPNGK